MDFASKNFDLRYIPECPSTNNLLKEYLIQDQINLPCLVWTGRQTSGRGRLQRTWVAPDGNLSMSLAVPAPRNPEKIYQMNFIAGLSILETINSCYNLQVKLKWPNDVLINNYKLCGILSETVFEKNAVIIGVGINLNSRVCDFPQELQNKLCTLKDISGKHTDADAFIHQWIPVFFENLNFYHQNTLAFFEKLNTHLAWKNQAIIIQEHEKSEICGKLAGLDKDGFLLIETDQGLKQIMAGDLSLKSLS